MIIIETDHLILKSSSLEFTDQRLDYYCRNNIIASMAVLKKCGFSEEGYSKKYLRINGIWQDHIHMVLLNNDLV